MKRIMKYNSHVFKKGDVVYLIHLGGFGKGVAVDDHNKPSMDGERCEIRLEHFVSKYGDDVSYVDSTFYLNPSKIFNNLYDAIEEYNNKIIIYDSDELFKTELIQKINTFYNNYIEPISIPKHIAKMFNMNINPDTENIELILEKDQILICVDQIKNINQLKNLSVSQLYVILILLEDIIDPLIDDKKYEILEDDWIIGDYRGGHYKPDDYEGIKLYRIKALKDFGDIKKGDLGGYIESEYCLSHSGNCWIYDDSKVYSYSRIMGNAKIKNNSEIDYSKILGNVIIEGNAIIKGKTYINGNVKVRGRVKITESIIGGITNIMDSSYIFNSIIGTYNKTNNITISGNSIIRNSIINGKIDISDSEMINNNIDGEFIIKKGDKKDE
jgi:carbonic anhydrase/acetyltransferase-like protein (isoleucine patch superfamily)